MYFDKNGERIYQTAELEEKLKADFRNKTSKLPS